MHVDALLCDSATVREGLLHILGGGVTRAWRPTYPAPLGLSLALLFTVQPAEAREKHRLRIALQDADGQLVAELAGEFELKPGPGIQPGEQVPMPMVFNLHPLVIPKAGTYSMEILVDGHLVRSMPFVVAPLEKAPGGPPEKPKPQR
jgi:hypothetical protein